MTTFSLIHLYLIRITLSISYSAEKKEPPLIIRKVRTETCHHTYSLLRFCAGKMILNYEEEITWNKLTHPA